MQAKRKVLARFPEAKLFAATVWPMGGVRHYTVMPGDGTVRYLDIHDINDPQGTAAAWRSAYYWCVRNPQARPATQEETDNVVAGHTDGMELTRAITYPD